MWRKQPHPFDGVRAGPVLRRPATGSEPTLLASRVPSLLQGGNSGLCCAKCPHYQMWHYPDINSPSPINRYSFPYKS